MVIADQCVVSLDYKLTNSEGDTIDASTPDQPLVYLHGAAGIIPGLEGELAGKAAGDDFMVTVRPEQGYGQRDERLIQQAPRSQFPADADIQVGMQFTANSPDGNFNVVVTEVTPDTITIDANHPLAGMTLTFEGKVLDIREATAEELEHNHAHGPGGYQH